MQPLQGAWEGNIVLFYEQHQQQNFAHRYTKKGHLMNEMLSFLILELFIRHLAEFLINLLHNFSQFP